MNPAIHIINGSYIGNDYYYTIEHDGEAPDNNYYFILGLLKLEVIWLKYPNEKRYFYYDVRDVQYYGSCDYHNQDIFIRAIPNGSILSIYLYTGHGVSPDENPKLFPDNWENVDGKTKTFWNIRGLNHHPLPPTTPKGFELNGSAGEHPRLSWLLNNEQEINGYNIYRKENEEDYHLIATTNSSTNFYIDREITIGSNRDDPSVCYRITAFGPEYESYPTLSKCKKFEGIKKDKIDNTDSLSEIKSDKLYNPYPNPFNPLTKIKFEISKKGNVNISIWNILGIKIKTLLNTFLDEGSYTVDFNGQNIPTGIYILRMVTSNAILTKSIMLLK